MPSEDDMQPLTETDICRLVDNFYLKVRGDQLLGPIFNEAIAEDAWPHHLQTMYQFWQSMMLKTGTYSGRPLPAHVKHAQKTPFTKDHFDQWLRLFRQTAEETVPDYAPDFITRAERVADSLQMGINFYLTSREEAC